MGVSQSSTLTQLLRFFLGSLAGLLVDLAVYNFLVLSGYKPWYSNIASSLIGICVTYMVVNKFVFQVSHSSKRLLVFYSWYTFSILTFSWILKLLIVSVGIEPFVAKLLILPGSFFANFGFNKYLLPRIVERNQSHAN
jgi:putative flippase GtrA